VITELREGHAVAGALPAISSIAGAQTYPARLVRIVAGFAAGGPADAGGQCRIRGVEFASLRRVSRKAALVVDILNRDRVRRPSVTSNSECPPAADANVA